MPPKCAAVSVPQLYGQVRQPTAGLSLCFIRHFVAAVGCGLPPRYNLYYNKDEVIFGNYIHNSLIERLYKNSSKST